MKKFRKKLSLLTSIVMVLVMTNTGAQASHADNSQVTSSSTVSTTTDTSIVISTTTPRNLYVGEEKTIQNGILIDRLEVEGDYNNKVQFSLPKNTHDNDLFEIPANSNKQIKVKENLEEKEYKVTVRATVENKHNDKTFVFDVKKEREQVGVLITNNPEVKQNGKESSFYLSLSFKDDTVSENFNSLKSYLNIENADFDISENGSHSNLKRYKINISNINSNKIKIKFNDTEDYKFKMEQVTDKDGFYELDITAFDENSIKKIEVSPISKMKTNYTEGEKLDFIGLSLILTDTKSKVANFKVNGEADLSELKIKFNTEREQGSIINYNTHSTIRIMPKVKAEISNPKVATEIQLTIKKKVYDINGIQKTPLKLNTNETSAGSIIIPEIEVKGGQAPYTFKLLPISGSVVNPNESFEIIKESNGEVNLKAKKALTEEDYTFKVQVEDSSQPATTTEKQFSVKFLKADEVIKLESLKADGESGVKTTTYITLTFDKDPGDLTGKVSVSNATVDRIEGSGNTRTVYISNIQVKNDSTVTVTISKLDGKEIQYDPNVNENRVKVYIAKISDITAKQYTDLQEGEDNVKVGKRVLSNLNAVGGKGKKKFEIVSPKEKFKIFEEDNSINPIKYHVVIAGSSLTAGNYDIKVKAIDELKQEYTKTFTITVNPVDPEITKITGDLTQGLQEGKDNTKVGQTVISNLKVDGGTGNILFTLLSPTDKFELSSNNSVVIKGSPLTEGNYPITISAVDKKGKTKQETFTINVASKEVTPKQEDKKKLENITFTSITADGSSHYKDTSILTLTFDKAPGNLTKDNIKLSNGNISKVEQTDNIVKLHLSNITLSNGSELKVTLTNPEGKNISPLEKSVKIYRRTSSSDDSSSSDNSSSGGSGGSSSNSSKPKDKSKDDVKKDESKKDESKKSNETVKKDETKTTTNKNEKVSTTLSIGKKTYTVVVDGVKVEKTADVAPVIKEGRTMLPARMISEMLGLEVKYNKATRTATFLSDKDNKVEITLGNKYMLVNGQKIDLTTDILNVNGRILLPIRDIQTAFKKLGLKTEIEWDAKTKSVTVNK